MRLLSSNTMTLFSIHSIDPILRHVFDDILDYDTITVLFKIQ